MWKELADRLRLVVMRARVTLVDDAGPVQLPQAQMSFDWRQDKLPRLAEYGFQSSPPVGADAIVLFLGGNPSDGVVVATGHQTYRVRGLSSGEVCLSDDKGQKIYLSASGIRVDGGGLPVTITNTPSVTADTAVFRCTGDIIADGEVKDQGGNKSMSGMRGTFNSHRNGGAFLSTPPM